MHKEFITELLLSAKYIWRIIWGREPQGDIYAKAEFASPMAEKEKKTELMTFIIDAYQRDIGNIYEFFRLQPESSRTSIMSGVYQLL